MAGIPKNFDAVSNVLPTYNYIDIASGTGIINFYAGDTIDLKLLSNSTFYSDTIVSSANIPQTTDTKVLDHDYDVVFNRPINIAGKVVLNVPIALTVRGVSPSTNHVYVIAKVRKWDGSTETDIVSNTSRDPAFTAVGYDMVAIDLDIPLTHFKIGETLRLTIELWGYYTAGAAGVTTAAYAHDPMNRTTGWDSTGAVPSKLTFQVPTRLNL